MPAAVVARPPKANTLAVLAQESLLAANPVYLVAQAIVYWHGRIMHGFSILGSDKIPRDRPALIVGTHTFNTYDISLAALHGQLETGRLVYAMMHRPFMYTQPWLQLIGLLPGERGMAVGLLRRGKLVACLPGGAEEFLFHGARNGADAYELMWRSRRGNPRRGFAHIAVGMGPGFEVFPTFCENGEEMRFTPPVEVFTALRLDRLYGLLLRSLPPPLDFFLYCLALFFSGIAAFALGVPVPVCVTLHVGDAVVVREGETADGFGDRVEGAMRGLIGTVQGRRHRSYFDSLARTYGGWWANGGWGTSGRGKASGGGGRARRGGKEA